MVLPQFEYFAPKTIGEACNLFLELGSTARVMAGTMDLIPSIKDKVIPPEYIINPKKIPGLDYLEYDDKESLRIGALTTLRIIEISSFVKEKNPAVVYAAKVVASIQIKTEGIMAGNICNVSPSYDTAPNLLTQGAKILVQGPNKGQVIQTENFFPGVRKTSLEPGEVVTGTVIPSLTRSERAACTEHVVRKAVDLAIIGVVIKTKVEDGICTDARIVLGVVAATPVQAPGAEEVPIGKELTDEVVVETSEETVNSCHPISDIHVSVEYRKDMIRVFTKCAIKRVMECYNQGGDRNET